MCTSLCLKFTVAISILSIIIGAIVGSIGAAELPRHINFDASNPMPKDPSVASKQLNDLRINSPAYNLVIIGCSLFGTGVLCLVFSLVPLLCCFAKQVAPLSIDVTMPIKEPLAVKISRWLPATSQMAKN